MIYKYKVGDKIRIKTACSGTVVGEEIILHKSKGGSIWAKGKNSTDKNGCVCPNRWELIAEGYGNYIQKNE